MKKLQRSLFLKSILFSISSDANLIMYLRDPITTGAHYVIYDYKRKKQVSKIYRMMDVRT